MRLTVVARGPDHASSRVRALQYVEPLRWRGHEVRVVRWEPASGTDVARLTPAALRDTRWADVVLVVKPRLHPWVLEAMRRLNPRLVVDVDDAMWTWGEIFARRFDDGARRASTITAGNQHLTDVLAARYPGTRTVRVPTAIDLARYAPRPPFRDVDVPVIGWIGGPASLTDFTDPVVDALREVTATGAARLRIVCSEPLARAGLDADYERWGIDTEVASLQGFDVGIMPLRDDEASWGRCGLKALQYMAVGVPVVVSPIGAGPEMVEPGREGFLATSTEEWVDALSSLVASAELRTGLGAQARRRVEEQFSVDANTPRLEVVLEGA